MESSPEREAEEADRESHGNHTFTLTRPVSTWDGQSNCWTQLLIQKIGPLSV